MARPRPGRRHALNTLVDKSSSRDTIAAVATPPGRGGVGIIRISGPLAPAIGQAITATALAPRHAHYCRFAEPGPDGPRTIDEGIALFFPGPHSFTGEDVVELQGHGGPVVLDLLLREVLRLGAVLARPGQFSERAFLNDKIDLSQAEAIADLIASTSQEAARSALRSLQGEFSNRIRLLVDTLIELRVYVEAAIDFPEEEIDFLNDGHVSRRLDSLLHAIDTVLEEARQGAILREGMTVVIAGKPNAGKSSLLNALAERDTAIVSDIAGTTRDVLREHIHIEGMPLHVIDTAGLRDDPDAIEKIGIARAWREITAADRVLLVCDSCLSQETNPEILSPALIEALGGLDRITLILSKCDISGIEPGLSADGPAPCIRLSATTGQGLAALRRHLKGLMGYTGGEGHFTARRRHLEALLQARALVDDGRAQLLGSGAGELLADDLLRAQRALGTITGEFRPDDLLGHIFASFCIGK